MIATATIESDAPVLVQPVVRRWLVAEYCGHDIYMGWHLYLRDDSGYQKRNEDGGWGWVRGPVWERDRKGNRMVEFFAIAFGINLKGDWSCGHYGLDEFVKRYPLKGRKIWGEKRGGVEVLEDYWGTHALYTPNPSSSATRLGQNAMIETETQSSRSLQRMVRRREIEELKPLVKWGMRINSRRYLPLAAKLERLEQMKDEDIERSDKP